MNTVLLLASAIPEVDELRQGLHARLEEVPGLGGGGLGDPTGWSWAGDLERWREAARSGAVTGEVVVAPWPASVGEPAPLASLPVGDWVARAEVAFARWFAAMGVAVRRCGDGGSVVAVVERPPPLDCGGWATESGTADAVESMVRSLARAEGHRGVRVNAVSTPVRLHRPPVVDPAPSLTSFPGTVATEVVGAVGMLLGPGARGVTGTTLHVDCGRSWR